MPILQINALGRVIDPAKKLQITYADPWPVPNGYAHGFRHPALGVVFHTEVGFDHNVWAEFEDPHAQVSAFFSIAGGYRANYLPSGSLHQYAPIGPHYDFVCWAEVNGNPLYYSIENEDGGNDLDPLNAEQIETFASVFELCSHLDGFKILKATKPGEEGLIGHCEGGIPWGNHSCPGPVRLAQKDAILDRARVIHAERAK